MKLDRATAHHVSSLQSWKREAIAGGLAPAVCQCGRKKSLAEQDVFRLEALFNIKAGIW